MLAVVRTLIAMLVLCSCGRVGFAPLDDGGHPLGSDTTGDAGSGMGSGSGTDPLATGCQSPGYGDDFVETIPCQKFGTADSTNGMLSTAGGVLTLTPNANVDTSLDCLRDTTTWGPAGAFIEVIQALPGAGQTSMLVIQASDSAAYGFDAENGTLFYTDSSGTKMFPYDAVAQRWWRLRPRGGDVLGEVSPDGMTWTTLAITHATADTNVAIIASASVHPVANPGSAVFGGIDVCP